MILTCVAGIPLAYVLGRSRSITSRIVEVTVTLPLALPPVMGGIIVVYLVGPYSFLGSHLGRQLTNSVYGIVIAMTFSVRPVLDPVGPGRLLDASTRPSWTWRRRSVTPSSRASCASRYRWPGPRSVPAWP